MTSTGSRTTTSRTPRSGSTHRPLPLYQAGGEREARFVALQDKEETIAAEVADLDIEGLRRLLGRLTLLSANAKTSVSLDLPIGRTCRPTRLCARVCYASSSGAPATWPKCLRKRLRNLRYFELEEAERAVARLTREFAKAQRRWAKKGVRVDYLRVNGTGDLFPAVIPVLNGFAKQNPEVRVWIVTRRFDLAALIEPLSNVYLQLSLDATTPPKLERQARRIVETHARAYLSFLRTSPTDDTRGAAIVFAEKRTSGLPYNARTDCPVDAGKLELGNVRGVGGTACAKCRKCFSASVLQRQHELGGRAGVTAVVPEAVETRINTNLGALERPLSTVASACTDTGSSGPGPTSAWRPCSPFPSGSPSFAEELRKSLKRRTRGETRWHARAHARRRRRGPIQPEGLSEPVCYRASRRFRPQHVRRQFSSLAHTITRKLEEGTYRPEGALALSIPKEDGRGRRAICVLGIPDVAAGNLIRRELLAKYEPRFSDYAFGHRTDRGIEQAVDHLARSMGGEPLWHVVHVDFRNYFDTIDHPYLRTILSDAFEMTPREMAALEPFLTLPTAATVEDFAAGRFIAREAGIAQGSPLSLFFQNAACWELDHELEQFGSPFARVVDDLRVLCRTRADVDQVMRMVLRHCDRAGLGLNQKKLRITTISRHAMGAAVENGFNFVGRRIAYPGIGISTTSVRRMKKRVVRSLRRWLARARLGTGTIDASREAYIGMRRALQRLIYGWVPHREVLRVLAGGSYRQRPVRGLGYLAIPDGSYADALRRLDGWLVDQIAKRCRRNGVPLTKSEIAGGAWGGQIPSFFLGWRYRQIAKARTPARRSEHYEDFDPYGSDFEEEPVS